MELSAVFTGALTWRRLAVLLAGLPAASRLARVIDPRAAWTQNDHLVAQAADNAALVADEVGLMRWTYAAANTPKGKRRPKRPKPYPRLPRPGDAAARPAPRARMKPSQAIRLAAAMGGGA